MTKEFREAFLAELAAREGERGLLPDIHRKAGVSLDLLKKLKARDGARPNVDDAVRIANYFEKTLSEFIEEPGAERRLQIADRDKIVRALSDKDEPAP
ncbi:hypothetical protein GE300_22630 [Rhodobacteraceae bacterium 2CG4]|uniref:HTH cro/C1-type domain-containing protein n=1 Tax=Halovulum marinum TaxID=2662447 RepID=A0A6L5Z6Y4_9RHOB|nr:hypothetical protein [Halovulum marinum]MSU92328.1 hypothetical protein [Halovulum marinum]